MVLHRYSRKAERVALRDHTGKKAKAGINARLARVPVCLFPDGSLKLYIISVYNYQIP